MDFTLEPSPYLIEGQSFDEQGRFAENAEPRAYRLVAADTSGFLPEPMDVEVPASNVRVVLRHGPACRAPSRTSGAPRCEGPRDARRRFNLSGLPPGRFTLFLQDETRQGLHREELDLPAEGTGVREVTPRWEPYSGRDSP